VYIYIYIANRHRGRHIDLRRKTDRGADIETDVYGQIKRQTGRQTYIHTNRQTRGETDRWTHK